MGKQRERYICAKQVEVSFRDRMIFELEKLEVYRGDRIGIVGLNGAGKTTLLNVLYGSLQPQRGMVWKDCSITYFKQFDEEQEYKKMGRLQKEFQVEKLLGHASVSGGENTRIRLAEALQKNASVVFVDEPTSNLDIKGITLVAEKLEKMETFLMITHDRALLQKLCNRIVEVENQKVTVYEMGYEKYRQVKEEDRKREQREYEAYLMERKRLQSVYIGKKQKAAEIGRKPKGISPREARLRNFLASRPYDGKQLAMERQANAVASRIEHLEKKEKPKETPRIHIDFSLTNPPENRRVIRVDGLQCRYGTKSVLEDVKFTVENGHKIAIVGENGAGKTTLLNAIIGEEEGVYVVPKVRFGYYHQQFEQLDLSRSVLWNVMQESVQKEEVARIILARLLLEERFINESVGKLSGGEKAKLAIAKLLVSSANVLVLDEPTNYLDAPSVEAMTEVLMEYEGTILLVSHDEALIHTLTSELLVIQNKKVIPFRGDLHSFYERKTRSVREGQLRIEIQALEMRLISLVARMEKQEEKEQIEEEYEQTVEKLSRLRKELKN